ncbi:Uncharacterised protein [Mycobacteroides abscessus subsp. abscessus]|nr:Uncharacterised protein [Mycobacteroides abscessus subsp. abscessus]SII38488.1 Uncharacterised protein [Mycobacteroides abscessus subsp. abscessus]
MIRCLFQHHVRVGAADPEGAHTSAARSVSLGPVHSVGRHAERTTGQVQQRILGAVVQIRGYYAMLDGQHGLDEPRHPGCGVGMTDIRLGGAQHAVASPISGFPERLGQRRHFDGIAHRRTRPMCLDHADRTRLYPGNRVRRHDDLALGSDTGGGEPGLVPSVVVDRASLDNGPDSVAIGQRVGQTLEQHNSHAVTWKHACRGGIEGPAPAIRRERPVRCVSITLARVRIQAHSTGQSQVTSIVQQFLTCQVYRHERRRTCRADRNTRTGQIQMVGDSAGKRPRRIGESGRQCICRRRTDTQMGKHIGDEVARLSGARVYPDQSLVAIRVVAGLLEHVVSALEEEPMLRIDHRGLGRRVTEECGVEEFDSVNSGLAAHPPGRRRQPIQRSCSFSFFRK